jgi:hypothetical protein
MNAASESQKIPQCLSNFSKRVAPRLRRVVLFCGAYLVIAFSYSLIAFIHVQPVSPLPEYTTSSFAIEILGHFTFGIIAALPFLDYEIILISGICSVLIDSDHLLDALKFNVDGRPDHSIFFIFVSAVLLVLVARRMKFSKPSKVKVAFLAPAIVTNHIAYDILAQKGPSTFALFIPFNFQEFTLPLSDWYTLLFGAIMISAIGYLVSRRIELRLNEKPESKTKIA